MDLTTCLECKDKVFDVDRPFCNMCHIPGCDSCLSNVFPVCNVCLRKQSNTCTHRYCTNCIKDVTFIIKHIDEIELDKIDSNDDPHSKSETREDSGEYVEPLQDRKSKCCVIL